MFEDEEDEFSESDSDASAADSDAQSSSSSECKQILEVSDIDLLPDSSDSESDPHIPELIELTEAEKNTQKTLFAFFDQLTKDAISFFKQRFAMFDTEPLCFFEAAFDRI